MSKDVVAFVIGIHEVKKGTSIKVRNEMYKLRKQEIEEQKEILTKYIGRCFKREDTDIW